MASVLYVNRGAMEYGNVINIHWQEGVLYWVFFFYLNFFPPASLDDKLSGYSL